jgi:hypothetical protein
MYLVKALQAAVGNVRFDKQVKWAAGQVRQVEDTEMQWYWNNSTVFQVLDGPGLSGVDQGNHAIGYIDFDTGAFQAGKLITIGGIVFTEADTAVPATGVFTNGASAANSATSLIAAINGDLRTAVPFTAYADVSGDGVVVVWDAVGVPADGVVIATSGTNSSIETPAVHGVAPDSKKICRVAHTVTTQQLKAGAIVIPLPFAPTGFFAQVWTAGVDTPSITDVFTIESAPNSILITITGGTNVANGDVVRIQAWE